MSILVYQEYEAGTIRSACVIAETHKEKESHEMIKLSLEKQVYFLILLDTCCTIIWEVNHEMIDLKVCNVFNSLLSVLLGSRNTWFNGVEPSARAKPVTRNYKFNGVKPIVSV